MQRTYTLTSQIHTELARLAESTGIEVEIETKIGDMVFVEIEKLNGEIAVLEYAIAQECKYTCISKLPVYYSNIDELKKYHNEKEEGFSLTLQTKLPKFNEHNFYVPEIEWLNVEKKAIIKNIAIQEPQIKQILIAFEGKLVESRWFCSNALEKQKELEADLIHAIHVASKPYSNAIIRGLFYYTPKSASQAFCYRWLDGLNPMFKTEPEKVLEEFLEILKEIK